MVKESSWLIFREFSSGLGSVGEFKRTPYFFADEVHVLENITAAGYSSSADG